MFAFADLPPIVDILLKVTVVLALAPLAARALSRGSAAARHQIWAVAIGASLLMPLLSLVAPRSTIAVLPAAPAIAVTVDAPPAVTTASPRSADPVFEPIPAMTPNLAAEPVTEEATGRSWPTVTTLWLFGVLVVLARLAFGTARVWWMARNATPATVWAPLGDQLAQSLGVDRRVTFLSGEEDAMPMAFGLLNAHVLLPAEADDWPVARQRVVLLHELAHVKRRDSLTQMLAHLACAAYWFNPLVWLAAKRLRAERERACDDLVLAAGTRGSDYADHLLDIARSLRSGAWPTWSAVTMAHRSQLEGRLMAILDPALPRRSPTRRSVAVFAAVAVICLVWLAGVRPVAQAKELEAQGRPSALASPAPTPTPAPAPTPAPVATPVPLPAPRTSVAVLTPSLPVSAPAPPPPVPPLAQARVVVPPMPPVAVPPPHIDDIDISWAVNDALSNIDLVIAQTPGAVRPAPPQKGSAQAQADPKITAALTAALKDEDDDVRQQALHTLVRMGSPLPADVVASMLKDKSSDVRQQAVSALGRQRDPKNISLLAEALKDSDAEVRQQAAWALAQTRDNRAVDPLIAALKDANPEVRQQAAHALGQIRDARAVDALIAALKDANKEVRQQAVFALGQIR